MYDYEDIKYLMKLEETVEKITSDLNTAIDKDCDLEILLLRTISKYPEIRDSISFRNKVYELRRICKFGQYEVLAEDWVKSQAELKKLNHILKQVQGKRDSVKLKLRIEPN